MYTSLSPSVPSHSKWPGFESSVPLTLLSVDYGTEILRCEDADGLTLGTGAEFCCKPVVPGDSSEIYGKLQLKGPIKRGVNKNRDQPEQKGIHFLREECSNSTNTMSVRLASSINCQSSLARMLGERTKVVTMASPLNKYGFVMSF